MASGYVAMMMMWQLNTCRIYVEAVRGGDRWDLSSPPPCGRAVRGSIKLSEKIWAVEIAVAFPVNQVLWLASVEAESKKAVNFVFNMAVG